MVPSWTRNRPGNEALFNKEQNPFTNQWIDRLSLLLSEDALKYTWTGLDGRDAANKILSPIHESYDVVGFDLTEAKRLGVSAGDIVDIAPEDSDRNWPTTGKLVGLNREEFVLEVTSPEGIIRCHFPRLGFFVKVLQ